MNYQSFFLIYLNLLLLTPLLNFPYQFLKDLKSLKLPITVYRLAPLDVIFVYTSIPRGLAIKSVTDAYDNANVNFFLSPSVIRELGFLCLLKNCFTFDNIF